MGHNSVIFLCNDAIGQIEKDPEGWWKQAWHHLNESDCLRGYTSEFGFGNHANGFNAVWNRHADETAIIIVGQNMAHVAYRQYGSTGFHEAEGRVKLLEQWAADMGYELRKRHPDRLGNRLEAVDREISNTPAHFFGPARWYRNYLKSLKTHLLKLMGRSDAPQD
jgi:hypothetical protein